jgi:hypothetical protein
MAEGVKNHGFSFLIFNRRIAQTHPIVGANDYSTKRQFTPIPVCPVVSNRGE